MSERSVWAVVTAVFSCALAATVMYAAMFALEGCNVAFSIAAAGSLILCWLTRNALHAALSEISPFHKWVNDAIFSVLVDDDDFIAVDDWKPPKIVPKLPHPRKASPQRGKVRLPKRRLP